MEKVKFFLLYGSSRKLKASCELLYKPKAKRLYYIELGAGKCSTRK